MDFPPGAREIGSFGHITRSHVSVEQSCKAWGLIGVKSDFCRWRHTGTIDPEAMKNGRGNYVMDMTTDAKNDQNRVKGFLSADTPYIQPLWHFFLFFFLGGSSTTAHRRPVNGFLRGVPQKMSFGPRKCLLGVRMTGINVHFPFWGKNPQNCPPIGTLKFSSVFV